MQQSIEVSSSIIQDKNVLMEVKFNDPISRDINSHTNIVDSLESYFNNKTHTRKIL